MVTHWRRDLTELPEGPLQACVPVYQTGGPTLGFETAFSISQIRAILAESRFDAGRKTDRQDRYQVSTDKRSGITNDPNRDNEPDYIVKLIGRVITVSLETQKPIAAVPHLTIEPVIAR